MPAVIAHRGASAAAPENTVAAFRLAAELGADMVELDVRRTADGALAVHHDAVLPDGRPLLALRHHELPEWVPTLRVAVEACGSMGVNVEIKNAATEPDFDPAHHVAEAVVAFVGEGGDHGPILVSSFNLATIDRVRALDPHVATAWLVSACDERVVERCVSSGHRVLHPHHRSLGDDQIALVHRAGLMLNTWTVDDPDRIRALADAGVDGIVTNVPDVARAVLGC